MILTVLHHILADEFEARIGEGSFLSAVRTLRLDVQDGLVPGATQADVTAVIKARGNGAQTRAQERRVA